MFYFMAEFALSQLAHAILGTDYKVLQILHDGPLRDYSYFLAERLDISIWIRNGLVNVLGEE